jgi:hypothetical protein
MRALIHLLIGCITIIIGLYYQITCVWVIGIVIGGFLIVGMASIFYDAMLANFSEKAPIYFENFLLFICEKLKL